MQQEACSSVVQHQEEQHTRGVQVVRHNLPHTVHLLGIAAGSRAWRQDAQHQQPAVDKPAVGSGTGSSRILKQQSKRCTVLWPHALRPAARCEAASTAQIAAALTRPPKQHIIITSPRQSAQHTAGRARPAAQLTGWRAGQRRPVPPARARPRLPPAPWPPRPCPHPGWPPFGRPSWPPRSQSPSPAVQ